MFPGGEVEDFDASLEQACEREVFEEMGIKVKLIKPLKPILINQNGKIIILIHYLAERIGEINPGKDIADWAWHDIKNLPENCARNVFEVIKSYLSQV